jgi:hypothetical protein
MELIRAAPGSVIPDGVGDERFLAIALPLAESVAVAHAVDSTSRPRRRTS